MPGHGAEFDLYARHSATLTRIHFCEYNYKFYHIYQIWRQVYTSILTRKTCK